MSSENWVVVYTTTEFYKIQLIKGLLEENDIFSIVINYGDSTRMFPDNSELFVNNNDAFKAAYLINKADDYGSEI
jgi:hypothetical protein